MWTPFKQSCSVQGMPRFMAQVRWMTGPRGLRMLKEDVYRCIHVRHFLVKPKETCRSLEIKEGISRRPTPTSLGNRVCQSRWWAPSRQTIFIFSRDIIIGYKMRGAFLITRNYLFTSEEEQKSMDQIINKV